MASQIGNLITTDGLILAHNEFSVQTGSNIGVNPRNIVDRDIITGTIYNGSLENGITRYNGFSTYANWNDSYVDSTDPTKIDCSGTGGGPDPYTLEAWVMLKANVSGDTTSGWQIVGNNTSTGVGIQFMRNLTKNRINFGYRTNSNVYCDTCDLQIDTWYHVAGTRGVNNGIQIYINNQLDYSATYVATTLDVDCTTADMHMGRTASRITGWFNGYLPIVRIYNKELTAAEVAINYEAERALFGI